MRATVRIELRNIASRELLAVRETGNAVMLAGAELIAQLFAGSGTPITHMGVGTSDTPEGDSYNTPALSVAEGELTGETEAPIPPEAFTTEVDQERHRVQVRVRGTLPDEAAVGEVREAGLIARASETEAILYNRVTFAPIQKGSDHELTLFWEISFPYGDLQ